MDGEFTYFGNLDDFALRHQLEGSFVGDVETLNKALIFQALVGERLLINDAYLVMNRAAQQAILNPEDSPLCRLISSGFVKVLSRNEGALEDVADEMAKTRITTGSSLISTPWYHETFRPELSKLADVLRSRAFDSVVGWPPYLMDECFLLTISLGFSRFKETLAGDHVKAAEEHWAEFKESAGRRTEWEDIAGQRLRDDVIDSTLFHDLMSVGNQAYQYSWASALTKEHRHATFRALTCASGYYADLNAPPRELPDSERQKIALPVPVLNAEFAKKNLKSRWDLLAEMVQPGHDVNIAKHEFRRAIQDYVAGNCAKNEVDDSVKQYSERLSTHFKGNPSWLPLTFDFAFLVGSAMAGIAVGGPVGATVGFGVGLTGILAAQTGLVPQLFGWMSTPNRQGWLSDLPAMSDRSANASLAVSRTAVLDLLRDVGDWKNGG